MFVSVFYSAYKLYRALKTYRDAKYIVSMTRNVSRLTGCFCSLWLPVPLRYVFYGGFAKFYGINMEEVEYPDFGHYETFTLFFTRKLKAGAREIIEPENKRTMCSPADGRVLSCGKINSEFSTIDCVKGRSYRLDEFMLGVKGNTQCCDQTEEIENNSQVAAMIDKVKKRGNQLFYMVIYLSPADYHRFHSPAIHTGDYRRHVVGYLCPVKPSYVNKHKDVFKVNERVNIFGRWDQGFYFESAVGATNVGSIKLDFDEDVLTNRALPTFPHFEDKSYDTSAASEKTGPFNMYLNQSDFSAENSSSINFKKAEMTGRFEMGSTVVLIFEADQHTELNVHEGKKLFVGEPIVISKQI
jgi:phosphatidylserine decarboxylase